MGTILAQFSWITAHFCNNSLCMFSIFSVHFSEGGTICSLTEMSWHREIKRETPGRPTHLSSFVHHSHTHTCHERWHLLYWQHCTQHKRQYIHHSWARLFSAYSEVIQHITLLAVKFGEEESMWNLALVDFTPNFTPLVQRWVKKLKILPNFVM